MKVVNSQYNANIFIHMKGKEVNNAKVNKQKNIKTREKIS